MKNIFLILILFLGIGSNVKAQNQKEIKVIAIYGDTKVNYKVHQKIVNNIIGYKPQLVVHTGDEVNVGIINSEWKRFNSITKELKKNALYFPVPGNHEMEAPQYYNNFDLPEPKKWYSYQSGGLLMLFFNTNVAYDTASLQYKYFVKVLEEKSKTASYIIAISHHPPFTTAGHQRKTQALKDIFVPLFKKYKVSVLFSGHVHA
ncbi:MAG: metallophosphoesterase, partial [Bacteroidota bacterium]